MVQKNTILASTGYDNGCIVTLLKILHTRQRDTQHRMARLKEQRVVTQRVSGLHAGVEACVPKNHMPCWLADHTDS